MELDDRDRAEAVGGSLWSISIQIAFVAILLISIFEWGDD